MPTRRPSHGAWTLILALALAVNAALLVRSFGAALKIARAAAGKTVDAQRLMMYGGLYADIAALRERVPETATLWWVSPEYPWLVSYFLYPRVLRWGSPDASARPEFRREHPGDWVVGFGPRGRLWAAGGPE
ncbi:MAG TPA: hypothetical protein VN915_15750 [Elusimicrobiota bacterium]|nr:hypothetical protein [Elusimicrobiota bacterium]